jgi:serine protease AprX
VIVEEMSYAALPPLADLSQSLGDANKYFGGTAYFAGSDLEPGQVQAYPPEFDPTRANIYTILLAGPLLEEWRQQFEALGVEIIEAIGPQLFTAVLEPAEVSPVRNLSFVVSLHVRAESEQAPPIPGQRSKPPVDSGVDQVLTYDIRLNTPDDAEAVLSLLAGGEAIVAGVRGRKIRIAVKENSRLLAELRAMPQVNELSQYVPPKFSNDRARVLVGIDAPGNPVTANIPFDGRGQIVAIADSGIDDQHPDFQGRLVGILALGRTGDYSDTHGHGTHVAGSIGGDGTASCGCIRGTAPGARLFFQSILDAKGGLEGLPWDLNELFDEAYQAGARIHNNSWGAETSSRYAVNSFETDEFVDSHRDMTIVICAGNEGTAATDPSNTQPGFVDWLSLGSPATCKNGVTVGASQTDRTSGGISHLTWGECWPEYFPMAPIANERTSGDPESMAAYSSRGPCDDRRIKPDVVAPGVNILSTKSSRAPLANFDGSFSGHSGHYAFMGGTSMATPIVAGCLALIREYYINDRKTEPSAALLKATLVNGTRQLTGSSAIAEFPTLPNFHQGLGCVHMPWTIPNPGEPGLQLEFRDTWQEPAQQFTLTGQRFRYVVTAGSGRPLRFCLAYTDIPGRALQNQLNLFVRSLVTGETWLSNRDVPMRIDRRVDPDNNVQIVRIDQPPPGDFLLQIAATNLTKNTRGQDFALVVSGDLQSGIRVW